MNRINLLIFSLLGSTNCIQLDPISVQGSNFIDSSGSAHVFHGHNIVVKIPPFLPITEFFDPKMSLTDQDIQMLSDYGANIVRLGVIWQAVETAPGFYDMDYLNQIELIVDRLAQKGIYTIIDSHQDIFSKRLCGEGVPTFYFPHWDTLDHECPWSPVGLLFSAFGNCKPFDSYQVPVDSEGYPVPEECNKRNFLQMYTSPEVASAFQAFWENKEGLQDKFLEYWTVVAKKFASNSNVIGYDILNEPFAANLYKDSSLFYDQTKFDREVLHPFYTRAAEAIRKVDASHMIFFEPAQFPDTIPLMGGIISAVGFGSAPKNSVLDEHLYCCLMEPGVCDTGEPLPHKIEECKVFHRRKMNARKDDADRLGVPIMISEWGACSGSKACYDELNNVAAVMDEHAASWAYWQFKGFGDFTTISTHVQGMFQTDGSVQPLKMRSLSRTYFQKYEGTPQRVRFDPESGAFSTLFLHEPSGVHSVMYLHEEEFYENGFQASALLIKSGTEIKVDVIEQSKNHYKVVFGNHQLTQQILFTLTARPDLKTKQITLGDIKAELSLSLHSEKRLSPFVSVNVQGLPEGYQLRLIDMKGDQLEIKKRLNAGDLVGCELQIFKSSYFGWSESLIDSMKIPNLHGVDLELKFANNGASLDL